LYRGRRFPATIIQHAIWLYFRFALCYPEVEELLAEREIERFVIDVCPGFLSVSYRRTGSRGPAARLLYDPARIDPATWLAARIGDVTILGEAEPLVADAGLGVCIGLSLPAIELLPAHIAPAGCGGSRAPGTARAAGTALLPIGPPPPSPDTEPVEDVWLCVGLGMRSRARLVSKAIARRLMDDERMGWLGRNCRVARSDHAPGIAHLPAAEGAAGALLAAAMTDDVSALEQLNPSELPRGTI
jgi:hypothetical protein